MGGVQQIYSQEDKHKCLPDDVILWRYVSLQTLFFYLNGGIFIPSIAKLRQGDPFEGQFLFDTADFELALKEKGGNQFDRIQQWIRTALWTPADKRFFELNKELPGLAVSIDKNRYFEFLSKTRYAWCWFQSEIESAAMWNTYGKDGVAIATMVGDLVSILKTSNYDFSFGRMCYFKRYGNFARCRSTEKQLFVLRPQFLKREEYASENEVRFVTCTAENENGGLVLSLRPEAWIKRIRLWPKLSSQEEESLVRALTHKFPKVDCEKSDLLQTSGRGMSRAFEDLQAFSQISCESRWRSCDDGVPPILKNL